MLIKKQFPKDVINIVKTLKNKGFKCYVVGGCIRDKLLKLPVLDWDLTTDASPREVMKLFKKVIPTGIDFGTVTIHFASGDYEVTTFRSDEKYTDGRRPDKVIYTKNIKDDLSRRDFTINAIAYDPISGELVDEFNGQKDLKNKLIRTVGDPLKRFKEDGLRPIRACRFAAKLNFKIENKTFSAISKTLKIVKLVSVERVHDELMKMLEADKPSIGIDLMRRSGLLKMILPELEKGYKVSQPKAFHKYDVYWHNLRSCDAAPKNKPIIRLAALLHDIAKPKCKVKNTFYNHDIVGEITAEKILKRLKFSNADIKKVTILIKNHMFNYTNKWSDAAVRRFMKRVGLENLDELFILRAADLKGMERELYFGNLNELKRRIKRVLKEEHALNVTALKVNGNDVMRALKIKPGPKVGEVLNYLLDKVLDDPDLNNRKKLLEIIKNYKK